MLDYLEIYNFPARFFKTLIRHFDVDDSGLLSVDDVLSSAVSKKKKKRIAAMEDPDDEAGAGKSKVFGEMSRMFKKRTDLAEELLRAAASVASKKKYANIVNDLRVKFNFC